MCQGPDERFRVLGLFCYEVCIESCMYLGGSLVRIETLFSISIPENRKDYRRCGHLIWVYMLLLPPNNTIYSILLRVQMATFKNVDVKFTRSYELSPLNASLHQTSLEPHRDKTCLQGFRQSEFQTTGTS